LTRATEYARASIYKRGRIWYADYRVDGKRVRKRVGASKKAAELTLKNVEVKIAQNDLTVIRDEKPIDKFLAEFMESCRTNNSAGTCRRYQAVVDHFTNFLKAEFPVVHRLSQMSPYLLSGTRRGDATRSSRRTG